ncbi:PorV/PorQ family protein [bacterium]|nr:PorV/PorQ family protein [bacterium]
MKRIMIILCIVFIFALPLFSQNVTKSGTTAATFLLIDYGVRGSGMGSAYVSVADDINAMYWNPAGVARIRENQALFTNIQWIADITFNYAAAAVPAGQLGTFGINAAFMSTDEMTVTTIQEPDGTGETFQVGSYALGLTYAKELTNRFSIGFNVKYIQEQIYHSTARGMAIDVGTLFDTQFQDLKIGMSISNYGTKMRMLGRDMLIQSDIDPLKHGNNENINANLQTDAYDLPLLFRVGLSVDVLKGPCNSHLILSADALHPNDNMESMNIGAEYTFANFLAARCGYKGLFKKNSEEGLCLGGSINLKVTENVSLHLDYAWGDFGILKDVQKYAIGLTF